VALKHIDGFSGALIANRATSASARKWRFHKLLLSHRLLIKTDYISRRIAESRSDFRRVHTDWLYELAAIGNNGVNRRGDTVNHDVDQQTSLDHWLPADYPCAADFAHRVVKSSAAVVGLSDLPAKNLVVKSG
jgi:hypothetical protein